MQCTQSCEKVGRISNLNLVSAIKQKGNSRKMPMTTKISKNKLIKVVQRHGDKSMQFMNGGDVITDGLNALMKTGFVYDLNPTVADVLLHLLKSYDNIHIQDFNAIVKCISTVIRRNRTSHQWNPIAGYRTGKLWVNANDTPI